jgi:hypothetical protein
VRGANTSGNGALADGHRGDIVVGVDGHNIVTATAIQMFDGPGRNGAIACMD